VNSTTRKIMFRWLAAAALACFFSSLPIGLEFEAGSNIPWVKGLAAAAKNGGGSGSGHGGGHGGGNGGGGSGRNGGDDDRQSGYGGRNHYVGPHGESIEMEGDWIEVIYPGGWKEEVEDGKLELKDPTGRTVAERRATPEDMARLRALAR